MFWMLRFAFIIYLLSNLAKPFMDDHHLIYITKLLKGTVLCNLYSLKKKCTVSVERQLVHKSLSTLYKDLYYAPHQGNEIYMQNPEK